MERTTSTQTAYDSNAEMLGACMDLASVNARLRAVNYAVFLALLVMITITLSSVQLLKRTMNEHEIAIVQNRSVTAVLMAERSHAFTHEQLAHMTTLLCDSVGDRRTCFDMGLRDRPSTGGGDMGFTWACVDTSGHRIPCVASSLDALVRALDSGETVLVPAGSDTH